MSIYRFSDDSPISTVAFHYADGVPAAALIEASKNATAEQISAVGKALSKKFMSLVPVTVGERDMLQVSNFPSEQAVINALAANQSVKGVPVITREESDLAGLATSKPKTFMERYSLRLAGGLNLIGDIVMHIGGYSKVTAKIDKATGLPLTPAERKSSIIAGTYDLTGGGLYTLGGLNAAVFGNSESNAPKLTDRTADFIARTADPQASSQSPPKELGNFFRRHAADVTLSAYTVGAGVFLSDGLSGYRGLSKKLLTADAAAAPDLMRQRNKSASLMGYGISSLVFKLLSLFITEKPKSEQDKPKSHNPIIRAMDWFVEKPLRIFGLGSLITDSFYAKHAYDTYKQVKGTPGVKSKSEYIFKIITTLSYFSSDILAAFSSKNLISRPLSVDGELAVIASAAQSITAQPQEKRDALVLQTAQFLGDQPEMQHSTKKAIIVALEKQIQHLDTNPWAERVETSEPTLATQR